jgi:hypothetical protein
MLCDILWSDPFNDDDYKAEKNNMFIKNKAR